jgi:hypothetical protein
MGLSLVLGSGLGIANLMGNSAVAALDARIHEQMIEQWARFSAWSVVFAGPMVEEIGFRLVLMGGTAWLVSRLPRTAVWCFSWRWEFQRCCSGLLMSYPHPVRQPA